jgi:hypothetical protein
VGHLLYSFYPVFVGNWLTLDRQPISRVTILRLFLSLPAIYLLTQQGLHPVDALGAVFLLVSSALYYLHLIINQRVLYEVPAQTVTLFTLLALRGVVIPVYIFADRSLPTIAPAQGFIDRVAGFSAGICHFCLTPDFVLGNQPFGRYGNFSVRVLGVIDHRYFSPMVAGGTIIHGPMVWEYLAFA